MAITSESVRNGVDTAQLLETLDAFKAEPAPARTHPAVAAARAGRRDSARDEINH